MASNLYRLKTPRTAMGAELDSILSTLNDAFARLTLLRAALIQEKDGSAGDATDWVTPAGVLGIVDAGGSVSSTVMQAAFAELDSFVTNGGPSLQQCCARFKQ